VYRKLPQYTQHWKRTQNKYKRQNMREKRPGAAVSVANSGNLTSVLSGCVHDNTLSTSIGIKPAAVTVSIKIHMADRQQQQLPLYHYLHTQRDNYQHMKNSTFYFYGY